MTLTSRLRPVFQSAGMFLIMSALMLALGDQFPFSHFPMYSVLPDKVICLRVTDASGTLLPLNPSFGIVTPLLKKQMERELKGMKEARKIKLISAPPAEAEREAGQKVLDWMLAHYQPLQPALAGQTVKLEQVGYQMKSGHVAETVRVLAEGKAGALKSPTP